MSGVARARLKRSVVQAGVFGLRCEAPLQLLHAPLNTHTFTGTSSRPCCRQLASMNVPGWLCTRWKGTPPLSPLEATRCEAGPS